MAVVLKLPCLPGCSTPPALLGYVKGGHVPSASGNGQICWAHLGEFLMCRVCRFAVSEKNAHVRKRKGKDGRTVWQTICRCCCRSCELRPTRPALGPKPDDWSSLALRPNRVACPNCHEVTLPAAYNIRGATCHSCALGVGRCDKCADWMGTNSGCTVQVAAQPGQPPDLGREHLSQRWCEKHAEIQRAPTCKECKAHLIDPTGIVMVEGGAIFCQFCAPLYVWRCATCHKIKEATIVHNDVYSLAPLPPLEPRLPGGLCRGTCSEGRRRCAACRRVEILPGLITPPILLCGSCNNEFRRCTGCGDLIERPRLRCNGCTVIQLHTARAPAVIGWLGTPKCHVNCVSTGAVNHKIPPAGCTFNGIYFGVELEVEVRAGDVEEYAAKVLSLLPKKVIVKRDGSLTRGFEIVSGPAVLMWHRTGWDPLFEWNDRERVLLSHDAPKATCGLHVHASRGPLGGLQIAKMVHFLHAPENRRFVEILSGRPAGHFQDYLTPKGWFLGAKDVKWGGLNDGDRNAVRLVQTNRPTGQEFWSLRRDGHRYTALNLTNYDTIEFRLFRGTMKRETFLARLEFCAALIRWCQTAGAGVRELLWEKFVEWFRNNSGRQEYPWLNGYLARAGYVPKLVESPRRAAV